MSTFLTDFRLLSKLDEKLQGELAGFLNSKSSSLHGNFLETERFLENSGSFSLIARASIRVFSFLADTVIVKGSIENAFNDLEKKLGGEFSSDEDLKKSLDIAKLMIPKLEKFVLVRKQLRQKGTSPHLHEINLFCDARPVFDVGRTRIEAMAYPIIMRLIDDKDTRITLELDEEDLNNLLVEVQTAMKKLQILKSSNLTP